MSGRRRGDRRRLAGGRGRARLRTGLRVALAASVALGAACAGGGRSPDPIVRPQRAVPVVQLPQEPRPLRDLGPEILLPDPDANDAEVARVGDLVLRQSHAFARLLSSEPRLALSAVDLLVFDVLVAQHAREHAIRIAPERVRELAQQEELALRQQVAQELGEQLAFDDYVWRIFGMRLEDWRRTVELRVAQRLYQGYVIRYLAMREDRVVVRYLVHKDRAVVEEAKRKVAEGADFATLAMRLSEDGLRREGGLLPPFGKGFPHPVADAALALEPGATSPVFEREVAEGKRWFLVYCLQRLPRREAPFAELREEIDRELQQRPLTPIETNAYTLRWRGEQEGGAGAPAPGAAQSR